MIKDSVTVAYVHSDEVSHSFMECLTKMIGYDLANGQHVATGGYIEVRCHGGDALPAARNQVVEKFLDNDDNEWLMWLDTDMGFMPDTVDRLLSIANVENRPIVGGLCFAYKPTGEDGLGGWVNRPVPTLYGWTEHDGVTGFLSVGSYPVNSVIQVAGTGSACILIHRLVFEAIASKWGNTWYDRVPNGDRLISEDLSFCLRAGKLDIPVHVDTSVKTSHHKSVWVTEQVYWNDCYVPHATESVDVIVPVLNRPQNAEPFMQSLVASTGLTKVYAVVDKGDEDSIKAWRHVGAHVLQCEYTDAWRGTFARKVNYALGSVKLKSPWVFVCGDDVTFHSGWLDHAQFAAKDLYDVVGTNDLANPRVIAGDHATHLLIRKSYIIARGGSWDGKIGRLCHEGYRHNFVDDEIVMVAKQRNAFSMSLGSKVEHRHPVWGTAEIDATYELGMSSFDDDRKTFMERVKRFASND